MSQGVVWWWVFLCAVAAINIAAWLLAAANLNRRRADKYAATFEDRRLQLAFSGVYVFGCAFRSVLPVFDIPRLCLVDSWASSVLIGRSIATLAELAFATQWALLLHTNARATGSEAIRRGSLAIVPLIALAEISSWVAVLTTSNLGHVIENSLWGLSAALVVASVITLGPRYPASHRPVIAILCVAGSLYVGYMFFFDVPMYWARWAADQAAVRSYLSIAEGVVDASVCKYVSFLWEDWRSEILWMSLYFSVGVWVSISLVFAYQFTPAAARPARGAVPAISP